MSDKFLARRLKLMDARGKAIANRDWAKMDNITRRLAKLPTPVTKSVVCPSCGLLGRHRSECVGYR